VNVHAGFTLFAAASPCLPEASRPIRPFTNPDKEKTVVINQPSVSRTSGLMDIDLAYTKSKTAATRPSIPRAIISRVEFPFRYFIFSSMATVC
jgi:hypothetical protein